MQINMLLCVFGWTLLRQMIMTDVFDTYGECIKQGIILCVLKEYVVFVGGLIKDRFDALKFGDCLIVPSI